MKKFIVLYHCSLEDQMKVGKQSKEDREEGMRLWFAWKEKVAEHLVDFGSPIMEGVRRLNSGEEVASKLELSGYSILQAEDLQAAKALIVDHPHYTYGDSCHIEVHELMSM